MTLCFVLRKHILSLRILYHEAVKRLSTAPASNCLTFTQLGNFREEQAKRSILAQVKSANSATTLGNYLRQYGAISHLFHFKIANKEFVLVELASEAAAAEAVARACPSAGSACVPVSSPLLWLRAGPVNEPATGAAPLPALQHEPDRSAAALHQQILRCHSLDAQLTRLHQLTRLTELGARLRHLSCLLVQRALYGLFPRARVRPFGSAVSGFGRYDCDVDMVLELCPPQQQYAEGARLILQTAPAQADDRLQTQRYLSIIADLLTLLPGCQRVRRILKARVPIVKYSNALTGVDCDLCMLRSGVDMTELLYLWHQTDARVAPLVRVVRHWADKVRLTNAISGSSGAGRWISNFGLTLLVVYFLQTRPVPLLPTVSQLQQLAKDGCPLTHATVAAGPEDSAQLESTQCTLLPEQKSANSESLSTLLAEFFQLYAGLELQSRALSVVFGCELPRPADAAALHVQNPLDHHLNVTRNVTAEEVRRLSAEAARATQLLGTDAWWSLMLDDRAVQGHTAAAFSVRSLFETAPAAADTVTAKLAPADQQWGPGSAESRPQLNQAKVRQTVSSRPEVTTQQHLSKLLSSTKWSAPKSATSQRRKKKQRHR